MNDWKEYFQIKQLTIFQNMGMCLAIFVEGS